MNRFSFLTQRADRDRLPVALLSGFLGSGKTTLVNAMLRDPRMAGTAVAVNEFGDIPLDRDLIDHGADKTVVMANGCLCCNLAGDMEDAVMRLFSRREDGQVPRFDRLLIEPSGLADPAPIAQAILRNPVLSARFRLEAIVAAVDAQFGRAQLMRYPETRKQIALADCLVMTKTDVADADEVAVLRRAVRGHNPSAPLLTAAHGAVDVGLLLPPAFFDPACADPAGSDPGGQTAVPRRSGLFAEAADPDHAAGYASVALTADQPLQWRGFEAWLRRIRLTHAAQLLRVKGLLDIAGVDGPVVVQGVHHVLNAPVELDAWPAGERGSRLVVIADAATVAAARDSWAAALSGIVAN